MCSKIQRLSLAAFLGLLAAGCSKPPAIVAPPAPLDIAKALCAQDLKLHVAFKDPASVTIGRVEQTPSPRRWNLEKDQAGNVAKDASGDVVWSRAPDDDDPKHVYVLMMINAKNSFGGYGGEEPYNCGVDVEAKKILGIEKITS